MKDADRRVAGLPTVHTIVCTAEGAEVRRGPTAASRSRDLARFEMPAGQLTPDDDIAELADVDADGRVRHRYVFRVRMR